MSHKQEPTKKITEDRTEESKVTHARVDATVYNRLVAIDIDKRKSTVMNPVYRILVLFKSRLGLCPYMKRVFDPYDKKLWVEEVYNIVWGMILLGAVSLGPLLCSNSQGLMWILLILATYRIFDIVTFHAHVVFLHSERSLSERLDDGKVIMRHPQRWLLFVFFDFVQSVLAFSVLYTVIYFSEETPNDMFSKPFWPASRPECVWQSMQMGMNVFYFSLVTVVTLGYGDFAPTTSLAKSVVVGQILIGLFFLVSVLAIAITTIKTEADYTTKWKEGEIPDSKGSK